MAEALTHREQIARLLQLHDDETLWRTRGEMAIRIEMDRRLTRRLRVTTQARPQPTDHRTTQAHGTAELDPPVELPQREPEPDAPELAEVKQ